MTTAEELIGRARELGIHLWVADGTLNFRAPRAAFSADLRAQLLAHKVSIIEALSGPRYERAPGSIAIDIPEAYVPIWNQIRTGDIGLCYTNVTSMVCRFRCPVDLRALELALHAMVRKHDALRCRLSDDEPRLRLVFDCTPEITTVDLSSRDPCDVDSAVFEAARAIVWRPFAPGECLFRPFVFKLPASETVIGFAVHHFIIDGWSFEQISGYWMMEYERRLRGQPADEDRAEYLQYSEFLLGLARWSTSANFQRRLDYWRQTLRGAVASRLPPDRPVNFDARGFHGSQPVQIDSGRVKRLNELAASLGVTLSDILLAGVAIALQRQLKTSDICLRHLWHSRDEPRLFDMLGSTVNPIILRIRMNPESRLPDVARQVHRVALEAFANQVPCYYVDRILDETGTTACVQTNFRLRESTGEPAREGASGLPSIEPLQISNSERAYATPRFLQAHEMNLCVENGVVCGRVAYLESVYDDRTTARFIQEFDRALEQ